MLISINKQSPDIANGVNVGNEDLGIDVDVITFEYLSVSEETR